MLRCLIPSAPFHGFSPYDIARSKESSDARIAEIEREHKSRGIAFLPLNRKVRSKSLLLPESFMDAENDSNRSTSPTAKTATNSFKKLSKKRSLDLPSNKNSYELQSDSGSCDNVSDHLTPNSNLNRLFTNTNSDGCNSSNGSKSGSRNYLSANCNNSDNAQDRSVIGASSHIIYKKNFVLPCRSAHSARVIKPNKRFLDKDSDHVNGSYSSTSSCSSSVTSSYDSNEQLINEPVNSRPSTSTSTSLPSTSCGIQLKQPRLVLGPIHDDPNFTWARSRDDSSTIISDVESDDASSMKTVCSVSSSSSSSSIQQPVVSRASKTKKLILRMPRLNIDTPPLPECPLQESGAERGKIVCGVCGAVRFYRFVKQARKFGIYSCEPCRKFISRMIHVSDRMLINCNGGKGVCNVPPILRTVVWEEKKQMINKVHSVRCPACWLKMCIRCYFMPEVMKIRLNRLLPTFMRDPILNAKRISKAMPKLKLRGRKQSTDSVQFASNDSKEKSEQGKSTGERKLFKRKRRNEQVKSLRQIRFEIRLRRKHLGSKEQSQTATSSNTRGRRRLLRRRSSSSMKNKDNDSDTSGADKSAGNEDDGAKGAIRKRSGDFSLKRGRCKFKEKLEDKGRPKSESKEDSKASENLKVRRRRRRRTEEVEIKEKEEAKRDVKPKEKEQLQGKEKTSVTKKRYEERIKEELENDEFEMVNIVKTGSASSSNSGGSHLPSETKTIKQEQDFLPAVCKTEKVTHDDDIERQMVSLFSPLSKSDDKNKELETAVVPLVVEKRKRGRRSKVADEVKPVNLTVGVEQETRQKRKAALNSLANIARVTGRITESAVENQLIVARNLKKRATAIARREVVVPFQRKNEVKEHKIGIKRKRKEKVNAGDGRGGRSCSSNRSSGSASTQGPRVKHVCRSASLVLGRQVATFNQSPGKSKPVGKESPRVEPVKSSLNASDTSSSCNNASSVPSLDQYSGSATKPDELSLPASSSSLPLGSSCGSSTLPVLSSSLPSSTTVNGGNGVGGRMRQPSSDVGGCKAESRIEKEDMLSNSKGKPKTTSFARTLQDLGRQNCELLDGITNRSEDISVSIDFWESYDPEEICKTGFALIGSDPSFRVPSLCFLCGSAGVDKLIHCACCCEPYHLYCLEGGMKDVKQSSQWWRVDWVCPRCAICNACGKGDGTHVSCNKCRKSYHIDCLPNDRISNRAHSSDRPWVCHSCLKCKSCNGKSVSKFVGNIPLCNSCFKLRKKGSFCPLCQKCYDDNDFDTKMMECGRCKSWVHAKCEGLSNEKYQVLSFLPESVEFICRLCCDNPPAPWWLAVEAELKAGYLNVLKSLTKNRKACELLKWSPKKSHPSPVCVCNSLSSSNRNRIISSRPSLPQLDLSENLEQEQQDSSMNLSCVLKDRLATRRKGENLSNDSSSSAGSPLTCAVKDDVRKDECLTKNLPVIPFSATNSDLSYENKKPNELNLVNIDSLNNKDIETNVVALSTNNNYNNCDVKAKFSVKECTVSLKNCLQSSDPMGLTPPSQELQVKVNDGDQQLSIPPYQSLESSKVAQFSPHATSQSDSGIGSTDDELKPSSSVDDNEMIITASSTVSVESSSSSLLSASSSSLLSSKQCYCYGFENLSKSSPSLLYIKNKVNSNGYSSLEEFHQDMNHVIKSAQGDRLLQVYHHILFDVFPWFDLKGSQLFNLSGKDSSSLEICDKNQIVVDEKQEKEVIDSESAEYYEDTSIVLKDLLGLSNSYYYRNFNFKDTRVCVLCKIVGDGSAEEEGRLLYCGHNEWVHANCALWSNEVFEEIDGSLQRVHSAISRSRLIRCAFCGKRGASVGCCYRNCPESYHFPCAKVGSCVFMEDKSIYCTLHQRESKSKPLSTDSDFAITRPIYVELVELEKKKKKFVPHHQVKVMVGSLSVESLGEFVSDISDQEISIIPCEFVCTRLYWSSVEPWRLVRYHIKTKILQSSHEYSVENDDNFTVDHSLDNKNDAKSAVHEPNVIFNDDGHSVKRSFETVDVQKCEEFYEDMTLINTEVKLVVDSMLDTICINIRKEEEKVEESLVTLSDPQTSADLLPPEIKDAIFEDLPHDILDGISMQDIFPKLMSFDDINEKNDKLESENSNVDISNLSNNNSANVKCKKMKSACNDSDGNLMKKPSELNVKCLSNSNINKSDISVPPSDSIKSPLKLFSKDSFLSADTIEKPKAIVKPDISNRNAKKIDFDTNTDCDKEKIKLSSDWKHSTILQVDGANDYNSGDSDIGSPRNSNDCDDKLLCNPVLYITIKNTNQSSDADKVERKENVNLCRILQVDGCMDSGSEYESGNDTPTRSQDDADAYYFDYEKNNWRFISQLDGTSDCNNMIEVNSSKESDEEPVKCMRCHRTYRTAVSYERHLSTCNAEYILSCSESDSSEEEKSTSPLNGYSPSSVSNCESTNINSESTESANNINENIESSSSSTVSVDSSIIPESTNAGNEESNSNGEVATSIVEPNSDFCQGAEDVVEYVVQTSESTDGIQESTCINSALYKDADSPVVNPDNNNFTIITTSDDQNEIEIPADVAVLYAPDNNIDNCILINIDNDNKLVEDNTSSNTTYYITDTDTNNCNRVHDNNPLKNVQIMGPRSNKKLMNYNQATAAIHNPQQQTQQSQIVDYQTTTPALIIQQVPSQQNVVPTYVDTYSQPVTTVQPQQNIHYITIDSADKATSQYPPSVLSNTYQIQSTAPAVQAVPTVVGTLIQPNGVEQLVLNTNPTSSIDMFGHQTTGGVYLSSPPPMYMNMETVVSNTVMSSSQFVSVPGSVPGMLSTYSATTTQVYQAAKPVIDIPAQSYLVINTSPSATATAALVDNTGHPVSTLQPQTTTSALQQTKQGTDQWSMFQYHNQQRPVDRSYKSSHKTTVARHVHKDKSVSCVQQIMSSTENTMFNDPVRVKNCDKINKCNDSDILKIMQNAQKIGPVHQLSKMVDNIHSSSSSLKKVCLNSLPVKQKPPEAKVMPQPKMNSSLQKLDSFADKVERKILSSSFHFNKKLCYNPNKNINADTDVTSNKVNNSFIGNKFTNTCNEKSPPKKKMNYTNSSFNLNDMVNGTPPPLLQSFINKESEEKFDKLISSDHRKVVVETVLSSVKANSSGKSLTYDKIDTYKNSSDTSSDDGRLRLCSPDKSSGESKHRSSSNSSDKSSSNDNKVRTYLHSKKKNTPVISSAFTAQMKEQIKSQLMKELHKNNHKYVNNHSLNDLTVGSNSYSINGSSNSNNRVLQPTLKENKILDRMKSSVNEKLNSDNNVKRNRHLEKKMYDSSTSSSKKEPIKEQSEKIVNGKPKSEKLKRKEIKSNSPAREEKSKQLNNVNSSSINNVSLKKHNISPNMIFEISSEDGFSCSTPNLVDAWQKVFEAVQAARAAKKLPPLPRNPYQSVNSLLKMLGLGNNSLKYMIEQLPGVSRSVKYKPTYHKSRHHFTRRESETKENMTGCARTEPYMTRNKYDMFSWLASRHRRPPKLLISSDADIVNGNRRATSLNLPMAMRFRHLRETSKEAVGVFRSDIHGRGLFCLRDIDSGEMVIEYAGEVIRSALTDKREKYYTSKGIGCYMFRIDDNFVVDATMKGNAARFINHSCEPNCYSRVVDILGKKHILIFALRRIPQGEELTYDYKFPLEDDKITCHCLSRKCRKYLN